MRAAHACTSGARCLRLSTEGTTWTALFSRLRISLGRAAGLLSTCPAMCQLLGLVQPHVYSAQTTDCLPRLQNEAMSHQQLLRSALAALANPATFSKGLFMTWRQQSEEDEGAGAPAPRQPPMQAAWRRHCPVVFVDATGWLNLAGSMSKAALAQVCCSLMCLSAHSRLRIPGDQCVNALPGGRECGVAYECRFLLQVCRAMRGTRADHFAQATSLPLELDPMALPTQSHAAEGSAVSSSQPDG